MNVLLGLFVAFTAAARAGEAPPYPATLVGALTPELGFGGQSSVGGHGVGRVLIHGRRLSADVAGSEGYQALRQMHVGSIFVGGRVHLGSLGYTRLGFYHQHEATLEVLVANPVSVIAGVAEGIDHRSGVQAAVGFDRPWDRVTDDPAWARIGNGLELSLAAFPDDQGPHLYAGLSLVSSVRVGPRRAPTGTPAVGPAVEPRP